MINFINIAKPMSGIYNVGRRYYEFISKFTMTQWHDIRWEPNFTLGMYRNLFFPETIQDGKTILMDDRFTPIEKDNQFVVIHSFIKASYLPSRIKREINIRLMREYKTKIITVSKYLEVEAIKRGLNTIGTLYPYYTAEPFKQDEKYNLVVSVGSGEKNKRNDIIADFVNNLPDDYYAIRIGSPLPKLINIGERYLYGDKLPDHTVNSVYARAKYLIFPSETEGLGLPMIEALYHNVVVIANAKNPILEEFNYPKIIVPEKEGDFYIPEYPDVSEFESFRENYVQKIASQHMKIAKYLDLPELLNDNISASEFSQMAEAMGVIEK